MAYITQTLAGFSIAERFTTLRADFNEARAKRAIYRTTKNELSNLSSRELADIGINPSMINRIAMEAAGYI